MFLKDLDLLLHLIDKNKIDIYDIPIVEITDQYMEYIHAMEKKILELWFIDCSSHTSGYQVPDTSSKEINEEERRGGPQSGTGSETSGI